MTEQPCGCGGDNICAYHADRDKLIQSMNKEITKVILPRMNRQEGQWKVLMWGMGLALTIMIVFLNAQYSAQKELSRTVSKATLAVAQNSQNIMQLTRSIDRFVDMTATTLEDHRTRLREIEHDHNQK